MYISELGSQFSGWLEKRQKRHNVGMVVLSGEAADTDLTIVTDYQGHASKDIFNAEETGLFL